MSHTYKMQTKYSPENLEKSTRPFDITLALADLLNTQNKWSLSPRISRFFRNVSLVKRLPFTSIFQMMTHIAYVQRLANVTKLVKFNLPSIE